MKNQDRVTLTLLYIGVVFLHLLLTVLIVGLALYAFLSLGILSGPDNSQIPAASIIFLFCLASLFVGIVITFFGSKLLLKPVNGLIDRMNHLAAGDYKARIHLGRFGSRYSVIREFSDSFNRMAKELEGTEMLHSDFINNFSHEFNTPIVSIAGFAKLLKVGNLSDEQKMEYLDIIEAESLRLSQMTTNVLNLTRVENQTVLRDVSRYNLSEQIRSCILLLGHKWEQKELDFAIDIQEHYVVANEELLKQVWINLLDNAIKYSIPQGCIEVSIQENANGLSVCVVNSGPVIPEDKLGKVFNKFYQADESHAAPGNGVGLAIVKQVIDLHGGNVNVRSKDNVTAFTVFLPK